MVIQVGGYNIRASPVSVLEKLEAAVSLAEFLVVERVDILEVTIQGKEKLCWVELGDAGCIYETLKGASPPARSMSSPLFTASTSALISFFKPL